MSGFLLDTNIPSEVIRTQPESRVEGWVQSQDDSSLYLSAVTIGELRKGITLLPESNRRSRLQSWLDNELISVFDERVLPVTRLIAERWGNLSAQRQLSGRPLSMADGLIAATAIEHRLAVVTRNVISPAVSNPLAPRPRPVADPHFPECFAGIGYQQG